MTNRIAIVIGLMAISLYLIDAAFWGGHMPVFLGRKFYELLDWVAFWR